MEEDLEKNPISSRDAENHTPKANAKQFCRDTVTVILYTRVYEEEKQVLKMKAKKLGD